MRDQESAHSAYRTGRRSYRAASVLMSVFTAIQLDLTREYARTRSKSPLRLRASVMTFLLYGRPRRRSCVSAGEAMSVASATSKATDFIRCEPPPLSSSLLCFAQCVQLQLCLRLACYCT